MDVKLARALGHPVRAQILQILSQGASSPIEMSRTLDERLGTIAYHTKVLLNCDCVELVETQPRRGATEHFYRAKSASFLGARAWQDVPETLRISFVAHALDSLSSCAVAALEADTFEKREASGITFMQLVVNRDGWEELVGILETLEPQLQSRFASLEEQFGAIAEKDAKRLSDPNQGISVIVAVTAFETGGGKGRSGK